MEMMKLPATEGNPENNQQQNNNQQQTTTRTVTVSVVKKGDTDTKIGSANIAIGSITGSTGALGGQATLSNVPDGEQTIVVTADGYKQYTGTITVGANMTSPIVIELEEE